MLFLAHSYPYSIHLPGVKCITGSKNTEPYFQEYVAFVASRNCDDLIKELRKLLPAFRERGEQEDAQNVFIGYKLAAYIRHTTVHKSGEPSGHDLRRQPPEIRTAVSGMIEKSVVTSRETILPTEAQAARLVTSAAALGYTLYRAASEHLRMKVASLS
jgi:hypothetical protein